MQKKILPEVEKVLHSNISNLFSVHIAVHRYSIFA